MRILRKLTIKSIAGELDVPDGEQTLFDVKGVVTGYNERNSAFEDKRSIEFTGRFYAIRDGKSSNCVTSAYFPDILTEPLLAAVENSASPVILHVRIGIRPSNTQRYAYWCEVLTGDTALLPGKLPDLPEIPAPVGEGKAPPVAVGGRDPVTHQTPRKTGDVRSVGRKPANKSNLTQIRDIPVDAGDDVPF